MQTNQVAFVAANIEIGQPHKGLVRSAEEFLSYLKRAHQKLNFSNDFDFYVNSEIIEVSPKIYSKDDFAKIDFCIYQNLARLNEKILSENKIPFNFGGDHSVALATVEASLRHNKSTHVIWIDAHADANSAEQSLTGNFHGMPAYYLMNKLDRPINLNWMQALLQPDQITYIGLRDLDPFEIKLLDDLKIDYFTSEEVNKNGIQKVIEKINNKNKLFDQVHLSFDIDSLDPNYGLCTGVPASNGLDVIDVEMLFQSIQQSGQLSNFDFVEINPELAKSSNELNHIYQMAYRLVSSVLPSNVKIINYFKEDQHAIISN
ncbi:MAG: arginase family protein [Pseudobdellovibrio sp.]